MKIFESKLIKYPYFFVKKLYPFKYLDINLDESQYWPYEKLVELQNERLKIIVDYAYNNIPGYRIKYDEARINLRDIKTIDDLNKLPIITREELQNNEKFVNKKMISSVLYTGGSTGTSLKYYESLKASIMRMHAHYRGWKWNGFTKNMKYTVLKSSRSIMKKGKCIHLIGELSTDNLEKNLQEIIEFKPVHLKGYVNSLYILAKYCIDNDIKLDGIASVTPSSENLYDFQRNTMEKAFDCSIYEEYCCNDGGACGWECEAQDGIHYFMERSIIEDVDGEMVVTDLWNKAMPFIRYKNGDSVEFLNKKCSCGRALPLMKVKGRKNDIIITDKKVITPTFLMHHGIGLVGIDEKNKKDFKSGIRTVQYVQKPDAILEVNIVKNLWCKQEEIDHFENTLSQLTDNLKIKINFVDDISKTKKMKRSFILNEDKELLKKYYKNNSQSIHVRF